MIIGSNAAENHPISFKYVIKAMHNGGKLIVVDPRFTRSASKASTSNGIMLYSKMRSGTDIAFMNGMMKHAIDNGKVNWNYLRDCTNASYMLHPGFETCREGNLGEFSGLQPETTKRHRANNYDKTTWAYQYVVAGQPLTDTAAWGACNSGDIASGLLAAPHADSVWAKLINQLSTYTISEVCDITGADPTTLEEIYEVYTDTCADNMSACIMYAMGSTQHTYGTQNVRSYAMMQLLMGNTGVAGGGINALRGESNVQGSTDMCLLWHILPGYLAATTTKAAHKNRTQYNLTYTAGKAPLDVTPGDPVSLTWWSKGNRYMDSLLQAWWPLEGAAGSLNTAYDYLPKADNNRAYSHIDIFEDMVTVPPVGGFPEKVQEIFGLMCWGQNPAVGGPSASFERANLANLDWLVSVDLWETETAAFWKPDGSGGSLGIPGRAPATINTTVYQLPAAASYEKEGSVCNSGRWSQWRYKAAEPPGLAMDDLSIMSELAQRLITAYQAAPPSPHPNLRDPVANLWWGPYCDPLAVATGGATPHEDAHGGAGQNYDDGATDSRTGLLHANPHKVAWEINGYWCPSCGVPGNIGWRVDCFWANHPAGRSTLQTNGATSSGNWLYCSHYVNPGDPINCFDTSTTFPGGGAPDDGPLMGNRQENRDPVDVVRTGYPGTQIGLYRGWSVCWPVNRRIIYNGASVYQPGHPNVGQPLAPQKWVVAWDAAGTVFRTPGGDVSDGYKPPGGAGCRMPFIMHREGHAHLFGYGRQDGPFPEHYEPWDTVCTQNPLGTPHLNSPTLFRHPRAQAMERATPGSPQFPAVATTYRLTEHWQSGQMTRNNPRLCQLQPEAFVELSEELATALGISNGDTVQIKTQRTELYGKRMLAKACVTKRFKPYSLVGGGVPDDEVHHVGVIWHYGYSGHCTGHSANLLTPHCGDANTAIPESKAFTCNLRKINPTWPHGPWL